MVKIKCRRPTFFVRVVPYKSTHMSYQPTSPHTSHPNGPREFKPCNCKRSRCIKKYCDCFANGTFCGGKCRCAPNCENQSSDGGFKSTESTKSTKSVKRPASSRFGPRDPSTSPPTKTRRQLLGDVKVTIPHTTNTAETTSRQSTPSTLTTALQLFKDLIDTPSINAYQQVVEHAYSILHSTKDGQHVQASNNETHKEEESNPATNAPYVEWETFMHRPEPECCVEALQQAQFCETP